MESGGRAGPGNTGWNRPGSTGRNIVRDIGPTNSWRLQPCLMGHSPHMRWQRTTHIGTEYDSAIISQPEPGDWGTQEIANRHTEEVLRIVDGMGGHDPIYERVLNFELDDPDFRGFVIGVGEQTPPMT